MSVIIYNEFSQASAIIPGTATLGELVQGNEKQWTVYKIIRTESDQHGIVRWTEVILKTWGQIKNKHDQLESIA